MSFTEEDGDDDEDEDEGAVADTSTNADITIDRGEGSSRGAESRANGAAATLGQASHRHTAPGSIDFCAMCSKRFSVTAYTWVAFGSRILPIVFGFIAFSPSLMLASRSLLLLDIKRPLEAYATDAAAKQKPLEASRVGHPLETCQAQSTLPRQRKRFAESQTSNRMTCARFLRCKSSASILSLTSSRMLKRLEALVDRIWTESARAFPRTAA